MLPEASPCQPSISLPAISTRARVLPRWLPEKSFCSRLSQCLLPDGVDLAHENRPLPKNRYRSGTFLSMASDQAGFRHRARQLSFRVRITASGFRHPLHLQSERICRADSGFLSPIMVTASPRLLLLGATARSVARILLRSPPIRYLPRGGRKCQPVPAFARPPAANRGTPYLFHAPWRPRM
jgi:hypothetical protein